MDNARRLAHDIAKYDPIADAKGGFPMKYGSGKTKPKGHYIEIRNRQQGLKKDLKLYYEECSNKDKGRQCPRGVNITASKPIPVPPSTPSAFTEWLANLPDWALWGGAVVIATPIALIAAPVIVSGAGSAWAAGSGAMSSAAAGATAKALFAQ